MSPGAAAGYLPQAIQVEVQRVNEEIPKKLMECAADLRNAALKVLANPSPSAPGNPPGVRSGDLRRNWTMFAGGNSFGITSGMLYSGYLEHGTYKMAARPYVDKVIEKAMPEITKTIGSIGG
jgi:hypothetical protein